MRQPVACLRAHEATMQAQPGTGRRHHRRASHAYDSLVRQRVRPLVRPRHAELDGTCIRVSGEAFSNLEDDISQEKVEIRGRTPRPGLFSTVAPIKSTGSENRRWTAAKETLLRFFRQANTLVYTVGLRPGQRSSPRGVADKQGACISFPSKGGGRACLWTLLEPRSTCMEKHHGRSLPLPNHRTWHPRNARTVAHHPPYATPHTRTSQQ